MQQGAVAGIISGQAPMAGPNVPKFERELVVPNVLAPMRKTIKGQTGTAASAGVVDEDDHS